jgi:hypothetical protein
MADSCNVGENKDEFEPHQPRDSECRTKFGRVRAPRRGCHGVGRCALPPLQHPGGRGGCGGAAEPVSLLEELCTRSTFPAHMHSAVVSALWSMTVS